METSIQEFGQSALARYNARHAKAQDLQWMAAGFAWNAEREVFEVEVCGHIVAECPTIDEVKTFSAMHHAGF